MASILLGIVLVFIVISTIYDDIRLGLIRNARILQGLAAGTAVYVLVMLAYVLRDSSIIPGSWIGDHSWGFLWYLGALLNTLVGFIIGLVLWHFKVWAAGDAKLFTLYCYLIPPDFYQRTDIPVFPGIVLLINIFTFTFLYLLVDAGLGTASKIKEFAKSAGAGVIKEKIKKMPGLVWSYLPLIFVYTAMFAGIRAMRQAARESISPYVNVSEFTLYIVLFIAFKPLSELARKKYGAIVYTIVAVGAMVYLILRHGMTSIAHVLQPGAFAVILIVFARVYQKLGNVKRAASIGQLRPGMILAPETVAALASLEKKEREEAAQKGENREEDDEEEEEPGTEAVPKKLGLMTVDGLTPEQIRFIKTRFKDDEKILVAQTIPFSPLLALGALCTFFSGKILISVLSRIFG